MKSLLRVSSNKKQAAIRFCFWVVLATMGLNVCSAQVQFQKPTWRDIQPKQSNNQHKQTEARDNQLVSNPQLFDLASFNKPKIPQAIVTRQTAFGVPFTVNPEFGPVREVRLHVSKDEGRTWDLYSRQLPTAREFPFQAAGDGLYWFAVQTVGSKITKKEMEPELVIVIDSSKPSFNVDLKTDAQGRMVVGWHAADRNLAPDSVRISYQSTAKWGTRNNRWKEVRLPKPVPGIQNVFQEEIAFYPEAANMAIDFQISIADKAGNITIINRRYHLPRKALNPSPPDAETNLAQRTGTRKQHSSISGPGRVRPPSTDPYAQVTQADKDAAARNVGLNSEFDPNRRTGLDASSKLASSNARENGWNIVDNNGFTQDFHNNSPDESDFKSNPYESVPGSVSDPGFQNPNRLVSSTRSVKTGDGSEHRGRQIDRIPDGQYAKLSSSRRFELDYQVEHIQATDISKLEIWVTRDLGQTWKLNSIDQDRQSPVTIEVDDDGVFGYRICIQTVDGLESVQPTRGDSADVWVEVDTNKPSVELVSVPYGRRTDAGKLIINWRATDRRLASKPITLYHSVKLDGPWQIIVEKLENTGQFKWPVTTRVPKSVYIRIESVDAAGNRNFHQTEQPIDLSGLNPRGMIKSVRPLK